MFGKDQNKLKPLDPDTPFMCSKVIKLNDNELKLLAWGQNFLVCDELDIETFEIETEKSIVNSKYDRKFRDEDDCTDKDLNCGTNERGIWAKAQCIVRDYRNKVNISENENNNSEKR